MRSIMQRAFEILTILLFLNAVALAERGPSLNHRTKQVYHQHLARLSGVASSSKARAPTLSRNGQVSGDVYHATNRKLSGKGGKGFPGMSYPGMMMSHTSSPSMAPVYASGGNAQQTVGESPTASNGTPSTTSVPTSRPTTRPPAPSLSFNSNQEGDEDDDDHGADGSPTHQATTLTVELPAFTLWFEFVQHLPNEKFHIQHIREVLTFTQIYMKQYLQTNIDNLQDLGLQMQSYQNHMMGEDTGAEPSLYEMSFGGEAHYLLEGSQQRHTARHLERQYHDELAEFLESAFDGDNYRKNIVQFLSNNNPFQTLLAVTYGDRPESPTVSDPFSKGSPLEEDTNEKNLPVGALVVLAILCGCCIPCLCCYLCWTGRHIWQRKQQTKLLEDVGGEEEHGDSQPECQWDHAPKVGSEQPSPTLTGDLSSRSPDGGSRGRSCASSSLYDEDGRLDDAVWGLELDNSIVDDDDAAEELQRVQREEEDDGEEILFDEGHDKVYLQLFEAGLPAAEGDEQLGRLVPGVQVLQMGNEQALGSSKEKEQTQKPVNDTEELSSPLYGAETSFRSEGNASAAVTRALTTGTPQYLADIHSINLSEHQSKQSSPSVNDSNEVISPDTSICSDGDEGVSSAGSQVTGTSIGLPSDDGASEDYLEY